MDEIGHRLIRSLLAKLYPPAGAAAAAERLISRLARFKRETRRAFPLAGSFSERDVILITYADLLRREGQSPMLTLREFVRTWLGDIVSTLHILPFFPSSSDSGFSVIDYTAVDPALGSWEELRLLKGDGYRLMLDAVINHASAQSGWFQEFRRGNPRHAENFIRVDPASELSQVVRPRSYPLLTAVETARGTEHVWTTFSPDQVDLNYKNPDTLLDMIDILLGYIEHGADLLRLDAIAYVWKEIGTSCIHLPQAHAIVQLLRAVVEQAAPGVQLVTETNVPHDENVSYFGNGRNEAHLVYNFTLPPLTAHAVAAGSALPLTRWAEGLSTPTPGTAFLNFTASHDGVGLMPAAGILSQANLARLIDQARASGGRASFRSNPDGSESPYELNVSYFDLLNPDGRSDPQAVRVRRFLVSQAIMLALAGIPAVYLHSLLGSRNDTAGVERTGLSRSINREKLDLAAVEAELSQPGSLRQEVFHAYRRLIETRTRERAFDPSSAQRIRRLDKRVFAVQRTAEETGESIIALHNVSDEPVPVMVSVDGADSPWKDLLSGQIADPMFGSLLSLELPPYGIAWLKNPA